MIPKQVFGAPTQDVRRVRIAFCPRCGAGCGERVTGGLPRSACDACGYVHFVNPSPAVSVLIVEGERVLLGRRGAESAHAGQWCMPCGYIERDEDFLTAARREVAEETGLQVEIKGILSVVSNFFDDGVHSFVAVLLAEVVRGVAAAGDDLDAVAWFHIAQGLPILQYEADAHIIERFFATRLAGAPVDPAFALPPDLSI